MSGPVLLCYDGSDDARHAIEQAGTVLRPGPAVVATVWQRATYAISSYGGASMGAPVDTTEVDRRIEETCGRTAAKGAELVRAAGFDAEPVTVEATGPIWDAVLKSADEHDAAAIVLGSRGLGRFESVLLGSVSHGVAQHAHRPVFVVPPPAEE